MKTCKINALKNKERMSTQALLQLIYKKIEEGYSDFEIDACGQHDIGGALSAKDKMKKLNFKIKNPGQRVGAMALNNTSITVLGSAAADVGWLNSGAEITVKGDAGDTAAHCAASGKIYIAGRAGTRSGALMKFDPKFEKPEFWVLKNTGSFSFEFMSGGIGVVCGVDSQDLPSVIGNRSCVGMVGGVIYTRGKIEGLPNGVEVLKLDDCDKKFLKEGLVKFLEKIERKELYNSLTKFSQWNKIVAVSNPKKTQKPSIKDFRESHWFKEGLFGDFVEDNNEVYCVAQSSKARLRKPLWNEKLCIKCNICINNCPQNAIINEDNIYKSIDEKCIGCRICEAVCPKNAWLTQEL